MRDAERCDKIFSALSDERRRLTLAFLSEHQEMTLPDLADQIAEREQRTALSDISPEWVTTLYLELYHSHIPLLEDADLVTYSQEHDRVMMTELGEHVCESVLEPVEALLS